MKSKYKPLLGTCLDFSKAELEIEQTASPGGKAKHF